MHNLYDAVNRRSPRGHRGTRPAAAASTASARSLTPAAGPIALKRRGHAVQSFQLRDTPIAYCRGCFNCWIKTPGICRTRDAGRYVARAFRASDAVFFLTPVTFGGYSSELKKALDRCIGLVAPFSTRVRGEVHHRRRYAAYPRLCGSSGRSCTLRGRCGKAAVTPSRIRFSAAPA